MGHASISIKTKDISLLIDPILSTKALFIKRISPPPARISDLAHSDAVLYTHAHYDHMDIPTLKGLKDTIQVITPWNTSDLIKKANKENVAELRPWQEIDISGIRITATPAKHWGARNIYDIWRGYVGYVIEAEYATVYVAGDTGYGEHFKEIARRFSIDIACLPIGAYRPFWFRANHLSPSDAIRGFKDLNAHIMIPIHWGTFRLSLERPEDPIKELRSIMDGLPIKILYPGESIDFPQ